MPDIVGGCVNKSYCEGTKNPPDIYPLLFNVFVVNQTSALV